MATFSNLFQQISSLIKNLLFPPVVERSAEHQKLVDEQTKYLTLYHYPGCPYCVKVKKVIHQLSLKIELKDARNNQEAKNELINHGGKAQVPCLLIETPEGTSQWLYESNAINDLLKDRFTPTMAKN